MRPFLDKVASPSRLNWLLGKNLFPLLLVGQFNAALQAFYAEIYKEARSATPGQGHEAIRLMEESGKLVRHYTLNVDGLAELAGCSTWHPNNKPEGTFRAFCGFSPVLPQD